MKKVKIFLASSAELDQDKVEVELFVSRKNKDWHAKRIFLELTTWKDFISSISLERTQNEYNRYIQTSDISIFLFHSRLGRYTREEFDQAHLAFVQCTGKIKKPRIYTYFKVDESENPEITDFRNYIDSLDHFYDTYRSMDELFVKFNRQLDKLENEAVLIRPEPIDIPRLIKYALYYFLLPLLVVSGAFLSYRYYQPINLTVRVHEKQPIPDYPFREGFVTLMYGDKTEVLPIRDEVLFKQIPSKYKNHPVRLIFTARGFAGIDTSLAAVEKVELAIRRDNSLGVLYGSVRDEGNQPVPGVAIRVKELGTLTDENGHFRLTIPLAMQAEEQRLTAWKAGYQLWDFTGPPSEKEEWKIVLKK